MATQATSVGVWTAPSRPGLTSGCPSAFRGLGLISNQNPEAMGPSVISSLTPASVSGGELGVVGSLLTGARVGDRGPPQVISRCLSQQPPHRDSLPVLCHQDSS